MGPGLSPEPLKSSRSNPKRPAGTTSARIIPGTAATGTPDGCGPPGQTMKRIHSVRFSLLPSECRQPRTAWAGRKAEPPGGSGTLNPGWVGRAGWVLGRTGLSGGGSSCFASFILKSKSICETIRPAGLLRALESLPLNRQLAPCSARIALAPPAAFPYLPAAGGSPFASGGYEENRADRR